MSTTLDGSAPTLNRTAFAEGMAAKSILENPYWCGWPKPSTKEEEEAGRRFVDGYVAAIRDNNKDNK